MKTPSKLPLLLLVLDILAALALLTAFLLVLFYAPLERTMGSVQKVFYFHVSVGWTGMLGLLVATIAAIAYLKTRNQKWDTASLAGIEVGMVFLALTIVSGSIWAKPTWNTWWTWDWRLTTALIMELVYAAYLLLRGGIDDPLRRARLASIYAIVGFVSVPLTFITIRVFRTIHPVLVGGSEAAAGSPFAMTPRMQAVFFSSLAAFSIFFIAVYWHRYRLGRLQDEVKERQLELETGEGS